VAGFPLHCTAQQRMCFAAALLTLENSNGLSPYVFQESENKIQASLSRAQPCEQRRLAAKSLVRKQTLCFSERLDRVVR
jgi:hypothetical protein